MVRIPRYGLAQVAPAPLPGARISTVGAQESAAVLTDMLASEVKRAEDTALNDALSDYDRWSLNYTNAPDGSGILEKSGDAFIAASANTDALSLTQINSIADRLSPRVRDRFQTQVGSSHRRLVAAMLSQATTERTQKFHQSIARKKETMLEAAAIMLPGAIGMDPDGTITTAPVESELRDAETWLKGQAVLNADRLRMTEKEFVALHMDEFGERLIEGLINEALADDNDELASALHKTYGDKIAQQNRAAVKEDVDDAALIGDAKRGAATITAFVTRMPLNEAPTIGAERRMALEQASAITDEDLLAATRKAINAHYDERASDAEVANDVKLQQLWQEVGRMEPDKALTMLASEPTFRDPNGLPASTRRALEKFVGRKQRGEEAVTGTDYFGEAIKESVVDPVAYGKRNWTLDQLNGDVSPQDAAILSALTPTGGGGQLPQTVSEHLLELASSYATVPDEENLFIKTVYRSALALDNPTQKDIDNLADVFMSSAQVGTWWFGLATDMDRVLLASGEDGIPPAEMPNIVRATRMAGLPLTGQNLINTWLRVLENRKAAQR